MKSKKKVKIKWRLRDCKTEINFLIELQNILKSFQTFLQIFL